MSKHDIDPDDIILDIDLGFGPEVWLSGGGSVSVCGPCLEHDGRHRRAVSTGAKAMDFASPNLCGTHYSAFNAGGVWDRGLGEAGRPRVNDGVCALDGCGVESFARGLCRSHYQKDYRAKARNGAEI